MANTIKCDKCGNEIEIDRILEEKFRHKIEEEIGEKAMGKARQESELAIKRLRDEDTENKERNLRLQKQLEELLEEMKLLKREKDEVELKAKKQMIEEEEKIKQTERKRAEEEARLKIMELQNQLSSAAKVNDDLKRKLEQGSQQSQGEVQELDLKESLSKEFPGDTIEDVEKGVRGADLRQIVKSSGGRECGRILWESKRTKAWTDEWLTKLKDDTRAEGANIPVMVTSVLPKELKTNMGIKEGVWLTVPELALPLARLLRDRLIEVAKQKYFAQNKGDKADLVYEYLTGHEFVQQVQAIGEVYQELIGQIEKERLAYERMWKAREGQVRRIRLSMANIYGQIQGLAGINALPSLAILELDSGKD